MRVRPATIGLWGLALLCAGAPIEAPSAGADLAPHLFVATADASGGSCAALDLEAPWSGRTGLEPTGLDTAVRHFYGLHYVVDRRLGEIQVIDPAGFRTVRRLAFGAALEPQDIRVLDPRTAYVTLYNGVRLLKIDPQSGAALGGIDLTPFADADGLPEMSMMALYKNHLFVQIQRIDRALSGNIEPPSWLAVVDVDTDRLIDVDPAAEGIQGVRLQGTFPSLKMHVDPRARRLFVSVPGPRLDTSGGIEEVDLDTLQSRGLIVTEEQGIGDIGAFAMISPDEGYALGHTDITESSHLFRFARGQGNTSGELYVTLATAQSLAADPASQTLFFMDSGRIPTGIHVFDARTSERLTEAPADTGGIPRDLAVARPGTPGEATDLAVSGFDPASGTMSFGYRPACGAADHTLVWGRLEEVQRYAYRGQACGLGTEGGFELTDPAPGVSLYFLVVGNDGASIEGSYGAGSSAAERPEDALDPACSFTQDLSFACDAL